MLEYCLHKCHGFLISGQWGWLQIVRIRSIRHLRERVEGLRRAPCTGRELRLDHVSWMLCQERSTSPSESPRTHSRSSLLKPRSLVLDAKRLQCLVDMRDLHLELPQGPAAGPSAHPQLRHTQRWSLSTMPMAPTTRLESNSDEGYYTGGQAERVHHGRRGRRAAIGVEESGQSKR
jgi:hypothetical protein